MAKLTLSVDDGCASDVRVAVLCKKYGVDATFYWPVEWHSLAYENGYEPLSYVEALDISREFEIGSHTVTHRHLTKLNELDAYKEIIQSKYMLENLFSVNVEKFCPPRGYTNPELTEITLEFYDSQRLTKGEHLVHIHPNSGVNRNRPWRDCITDKTTELWGHSHEFNRYGLWEELEEVLKAL